MKHSSERRAAHVLPLPLRKIFNPKSQAVPVPFGRGIEIAKTHQLCFTEKTNETKAVTEIMREALRKGNALGKE
jgi:hypothetical protein